jgi:hypothetical protein
VPSPVFAAAGSAAARPMPKAPRSAAMRSAIKAQVCVSVGRGHQATAIAVLHSRALPMTFTPRRCALAGGPNVAPGTGVPCQTRRVSTHLSHPGTPHDPTSPGKHRCRTPSTQGSDNRLTSTCRNGTLAPKSAAPRPMVGYRVSRLHAAQAADTDGRTAGSRRIDGNGHGRPEPGDEPTQTGGPVRAVRQGVDGSPSKVELSPIPWRRPAAAVSVCGRTLR